MCGLFLCEIIKGFHHYAISLIFSGLWAGFWSCFVDFCSYSYFSRNYSGLWAEFWELF